MSPFIPSTGAFVLAKQKLKKIHLQRNTFLTIRSIVKLLVTNFEICLKRVTTLVWCYPLESASLSHGEGLCCALVELINAMEEIRMKAEYGDDLAYTCSALKAEGIAGDIDSSYYWPGIRHRRSKSERIAMEATFRVQRLILLLKHIHGYEHQIDMDNMLGLCSRGLGLVVLE